MYLWKPWKSEIEIEIQSILNWNESKAYIELLSTLQ